MSQGKTIVCLGAGVPDTRKLLSEHVPPGFNLVFPEADSGEPAAPAVAEADFAIVWTAQVPAKVIEAGTRLKLIQKIGEGTDKIDVATAGRLGIPVAKCSGINAVSTAEMTTLLMLATLRRLPEAHSATVAGLWAKWEVRREAYELRGKQVGIVGLGKIGRVVVDHMRGFSACVVYHNSRRLPESEETRLGVRFMPLDELLRTSDVVSLHVPLTPTTRGMIGQRELALMKPTAILVNTCRGAVVDEEALYQALKARGIRGAGIDVWAKEPPDRNHPLFSLQNVVLTPHIGGVTEDSKTQLVRHAYANILKVDSGQPLDPGDLVSP